MCALPALDGCEMLQDACGADERCYGLGVQATGKGPSQCAAATLALTLNCKCACNYSAHLRQAVPKALNPFSEE